MKINWKLRFKNPSTLLAMVCTFGAFVYQMLGILGITPPISEDQFTQFVGLLVNMLAGLGILVDPTTKGISDSGNAMRYSKPRK